MGKDFKEYNEDVSNALWRDSGNDEITTLRQRVAELEAAVKKSNDRLNEERDIWDRMFGDAEKKLERIEIELDDCLYVLDALWNKEQDKSVTQKWAEILIRNKRDCDALMKQRDELVEALEPFVKHNSSKSVIDLAIRTSDITKARAAIASVKEK